jgi:hypothetical protein
MNSLQRSNNFADDGSSVIERILEVKSKKSATSVLQLEDIYETDRTVKVLMGGGFDKVYLTFLSMYFTFSNNFRNVP